MKPHPALGLFLLMLLAIPGPPARGLEDAPPSLLRLMNDSIRVNAPERDEYQHVALRSELAGECARLAIESGNAPALASARAMLETLAKQAQEVEDDYTRDYMRAVSCAVISAQGDVEAAERRAGLIPLRMYSAYGFGMIAGERARAGDHAAYIRLAEESARRLRGVLEDDQPLPPEQREWPSYMAWEMLDLWMAQTVIAGKPAFETESQELAWLGKLFEPMPLEQGAKAEVLGTLAYGYASAGDPAKAKKLIRDAADPIKKEIAREAPESDEADWVYGTESARFEFIRTYAVLGEWDKATAELQQLTTPSLTMMGRAIVAPYQIKADDLAPGGAALDAVVEHLLQADAAIRSPGHGPFGENRDADDPWNGYDSISLYYDMFYGALGLAEAGDTERLKKLAAGTQSDYALLAIDLARWRASLQQKEAPAAE